MTATPRPWKVRELPAQKYVEIVAGDNQLVVTIDNIDRDPSVLSDAALIVKAVNTHDRAKAALQTISGMIGDAVDRKIREGRLPNVAALLQTIQDTADNTLAEIGDD